MGESISESISKSLKFISNLFTLDTIDEDESMTTKMLPSMLMSLSENHSEKLTVNPEGSLDSLLELLICLQ